MDEMDLSLARRLVWEAARAVASRPDLIGNDNVTLEDLGLQMPTQRAHFRELLVRAIRDAGFEINPMMIPTDQDITLRNITMLLPGESTKGNKP